MTRLTLLLAGLVLALPARAELSCVWLDGRDEQIACEAEQRHDPRLCRPIRDRVLHNACEDDARRKRRKLDITHTR